MAGEVTIRRVVEADVAVLRELLSALSREIGNQAAPVLHDRPGYRTSRRERALRIGGARPGDLGEME